MKIAINRCFGGFGISEKCLELYNKLSGSDLKDSCDIERRDQHLIEAIEKIGEKESSAPLSEIRIVEIPNGVPYLIDDYHGMESIHEDHRVWIK